MPYAYQTLAQAQATLAGRLFDASQVFWPPTELTSYIQEALRTWNSLTSFWRDDFTFTTQQGVQWYDIPSLLGSIRPYTLTDNSLTVQIEQHLLEPGTSAYPLVWGGSGQFGLSDILGAIQRRRDETLSATGCTITRALVTAANGRTFLPDSVIDLRRVAWLPTSGSGFANIALRPSDLWELQSFDQGWATAANDAPSVYLQSAEPPLSFDVDSLSLPTGGSYETLTVNAGPALSVNAPTLLGVPDDWSWVIKFGALADLFGRESQSKDEPRAQYCDQRFKEGFSLMFDCPALLNVEVNGVQIRFDSVRNADDFNALWENAAPGQPLSAYVAGLNLLALSPVPDAGAYPVMLTVVENAPVPVAPADQIQLGRDDYDAVLDYAQHLAALKMGGMEFGATVALYQAFLRRAALYNSKLTALGSFQRPMYEISALESERNPVYDNPEAVTRPR